MRRSIKAILVSIGWMVVFVGVLIIGAPIVGVFARSDGLVPIENVLLCVGTFYAVIIPLIYASLAIFTPLVMATLEVLDDGV